ncbi:anaphase-promoting complex subunit Cut9 [Didymella exigua CBS 183.55]|uniref:Anaphase-promoting complex subunit Cut9 n=1 Tax=Didymella exigua CBS 183.55 TaxID=1150837 RepID=A0A6A5RSC8_9PLEO|nr:anaphase-promoting complex subunit Cut9 [Didymella exigua CBS 183.55]KAF1928407.1 anaphase-promoting complex subunit Cut9 [Didymella exigua CBS 183.55]
MLRADPTDDDQDAYWLANVHFTTGNYNRCQALLARRNLGDRTPQCRYLNAHSAIKLGKLDEALQLLGETNPTQLVSVPSHSSARQKLRHVDTHSRATARHNKPGARSERMPTSEEREGEDAENLKAEAAMCYLRGVCYARQNAFDRAKECYKTAVQIDVRCMEAFNALVDNSLMSPDEEWAFLESLDFDAVGAPGASASAETPDFIRNLYITRLSKYARPSAFTHASETLSTHYALANNPDMLRAKADLMFTQCRFQDALALTSSVLAVDRYNFSILPLHLAALYQLRQKNALYLLSHELADTHPDEPGSWLAVGVYYLSTNKIAEARRYFSKASQMDQCFGAAWIGFAHTFAAEGEHDQAISAYSTAARLFQGTHLPQLFLGMQNLQLGNLSLAREYLNTAYSLCQTDPLVLNEMGLVAYNTHDAASAIHLFRRSLEHSAENEADPSEVISTRCNLAMALRRHSQLEEALRVFDDVIRHGLKDAAVLAARGLTLMELDRNWDAVIVLHEALALAPQDPMATDLLNRALEANASSSAMLMVEPAQHAHATGFIEDEIDDDGFEEALRRRKQDALRDVEPNRVAGRRGRRRRHATGFVEDESGVGESMLVDSDG